MGKTVHPHGLPILITDREGTLSLKWGKLSSPMVCPSLSLTEKGYSVQNEENCLYPWFAHPYHGQRKETQSKMWENCPSPWFAHPYHGQRRETQSKMWENCPYP